MKKIFLLSLLAVAFFTNAFSQKEERLIQFSGYTLTADSLMGVPFTHITILNRGRVATAGPDGFFSFAAHEADTLYFTCVGFTPVRYVIPAKLELDKFSVIQIMSKSENYLPTTIIYPWGGRDQFPRAFIDLHLPDDDLQRAKKNMDRERLAELGERLEMDGGEAGSMALRKTAAKTYYYGQTPPQNIFNPLAWAEFIRAWKRGDFKKKDK